MRPVSLSLLAGEQPWRSAPMPGAEQPLALVRLASAGAGFVILGRFPAGFERGVRGGYEAAEEFLVLDGALELEGAVVGRGALCFVPGNHVRAPMRSPGGCTVLAWFSGPALFRGADELGGPADGRFSVVDVRDPRFERRLLTTPTSAWDATDRSPEPRDRPVDIVDVALTAWAHLAPGACDELPPGPLLVRTPLDPDVA